MREIKENSKNKKKLLVVGALGMLTVLGGTLAYFTTTKSFVNTIKTGVYQTKIFQEFVSPSNWKPGDVAEKTIKVTNIGSIPMAVRASIKEKWIAADGSELVGIINNDERAAVLEFGEGWTLGNDGHYYYGTKDNKTVLDAGEETTSFIKSIKFNENTTTYLNEITSEDGKTITFTSNGGGFDDATYTLTVRLDTVQYDAARNLWD